MNLNSFREWVPGIRKSLQSEILTEFSISPRYIDRLEKYYILHWSGEYFYEKARVGYVKHQGINYIPIYYNESDSMFSCKNSPQVALSFRKLANDNYPLGYVMIKILTPKDSKDTNGEFE